MDLHITWSQWTCDSGLGKGEVRCPEAGTAQNKTESWTFYREKSLGFIAFKIVILTRLHVTCPECPSRGSRECCGQLGRGSPPGNQSSWSRGARRDTRWGQPNGVRFMENLTGRGNLLGKEGNEDAWGGSVYGGPRCLGKRLNSAQNGSPTGSKAETIQRRDR